ncbi:MAG TPA: EMC3/TMCO1 family protein [Methanocorpusculum sp.]|nr:EMC3/TMCO1 family protein [Methanocorpusculum sp.]HJJ26581.1 EMC3/TMCO1 family protein [Methanocorpusculum sp.]HJJ46283.1 EMC3/TMCO1 family protein [Methanocorpusculum sp.]
MGKIGDKYGMFIAFGAMIAMMLLYQWQEARAVIAGIANVVIAPFEAMGIPFFGLVLILATVTGFYSSLLQKYTIDYEAMTKNQEKMKEFNAKFREAQKLGDERLIKKMQAQQQQMMSEQMKMSQAQFKPMAYILVVTIPIFFWLYERISQMPTADMLIPEIADLTNSIILPFAGLTSYQASILVFPAWLIWYILCSLCMTQIIRKALNIGSY